MLLGVLILFVFQDHGEISVSLVRVRLRWYVAVGSDVFVYLFEVVYEGHFLVGMDQR